MNNDGELFEFNAPNTITNLYEMANSNDDGADKFFGKLSISLAVSDTW